MKRIHWVLVVLPLLGIFLYWKQGAPPFKSAPAAALTDAKKSHPVHEHPHPASPAKAEKTASDKEHDGLHELYLEAAEKAKEASRISEESMRRVAARLTPEKQQRMADNFMNRRSPAYRAQFAKWGVDPSAETEALGIIRARELRLTALRVDYDLSLEHDFDAYMKGRKMAEKDAAFQLEKMLGAAHAAELSKMEDQMGKDERAALSSRNRE
ncbi:MAG: hypothetical protein JWO08_1775 [Verrucomicrobiaceae bacterium]|nr:hypothetical protein [Verrucomicrobiaceae bacterium]